MACLTPGIWGILARAFPKVEFQNDGNRSGILKSNISRILPVKSDFLHGQPN